MTRIQQCFTQLKSRSRKGFIAYLTAGDPDLHATHDIVLALEDAGVDIIELGIPFSDPLADGPVNQESAARALESGTTIDGIFTLVKKLRARTQVPLMCYTYANLFYAPGLERTVRNAARAGIDGLLMLDLPVEESTEYEQVLTRNKLDNICLVTPTTPDDRIARIVPHASGFIYCVSREGVTGMQQQISKGASDLLQRTRSRTSLPVALGFGISTPEQAALAARDADAVVVGSAIVKRFHEAPPTAAGRKAAARWVGELASAVHGVV